MFSTVIAAGLPGRAAIRAGRQRSSNWPFGWHRWCCRSACTAPRSLIGNDPPHAARRLGTSTLRSTTARAPVLRRPARRSEMGRSDLRRHRFDIAGRRGVAEGVDTLSNAILVAARVALDQAELERIRVRPSEVGISRTDAVSWDSAASPAAVRAVLARVPGFRSWRRYQSGDRAD